jgi:hypothetical protein
VLKQWFYTISLCWKTLVMGFKMCWKVSYIHWIIFQTLLNVKLTYWKGLHINTTYTFNINLIYETYEHQNKDYLCQNWLLLNWFYFNNHSMLSKLPLYNCQALDHLVVTSNLSWIISKLESHGAKHVMKTNLEGL